MRLRSFPALFALALSFSPAAFAQPYDTSAFSALQYRVVGPNRGGRSLCSAGSAQRPLEYFFGAVGGGLWKTTDGGLNWKPVTDGQIKSSSIGSCAVAESNPDVVWIGMGETQFRGNIMQGDGLYKSTDAGKSWKHSGLGQIQAFARVRVHPTNADIVYVAAFGKPYAESEDRGIYKTNDGGATWRKVLYKSPKASGVDISIDKKNPNVIFASLWEAWRTPWSMNSGGPDSGLYKSTDAGETWTEITRNPGLPSGVVGKIGVSVSPVDSNRVFAMVENENGGLFRSDDAGATWTKINDDRALRQRAFYYTRVYADTQNKDLVYVLNVNFHKSVDGGRTFTTIRPPHGDNHDLWIAPNDNKRLIASNDGGGTVSTNGGESWTDEDYPTAQLYHVSTTKDFNYHVCGAQQDNSTLCAPSRPDPLQPPRMGPGDPGSWFYQVGGGESGYIAPSPTNPNIFYAGSQGALITRFDRSTGHLRDIQIYPEFFSGMPSKDLKERWQWTFPIVFDPLDPNTIYATSQHLWKTADEGKNWERISPDLTKADPKTLGDSGGPITHDMNGPEIYATIFALAPSRKEKGTIWTGSDDGLAFITRDGGKNWTNITPPGLPEFARISIIDASPHKAGTAYLCAKRYQLDDRAPYIYRTDDYGKSWTKIVNGIDAGAYVHAVREDPKRAGLLYAGTEHGVYVSFSDGASWQPINQNLPDTQISDIVVEENDLVIATHGRSMWVMDDLAPLRQMTAQAAGASLHVFTPRAAIRGNGGVPIDFILKQPAEKVQVEILDSAGGLVRSFIGTADDDKKRPGAGDGDDFFGPPGVKPPTRKTGLNRFIWDLRYPGPETFEGMILWSASSAGPLAVPGMYSAKVTVGAETQTVPFEVKIDSRLKSTTVADLQEQFSLAMDVRNATSAAHSTVAKIRGIRKDIMDRDAKAKNKAFSADAATVLAKLSLVEEDLYQTRNRSGQDPLNFPIKLGNKLGALLRVVSSGDGKPNASSYDVYKLQKGQLDAIMARYDAVIAVDLPRINKRLQGRKLEPITVSGVKPPGVR